MQEILEARASRTGTHLADSWRKAPPLSSQPMVQLLWSKQGVESTRGLPEDGAAPGWGQGSGGA